MKAILTLNGGSSSIRFAVYEADETVQKVISCGKIERIGSSGATLIVRDTAGKHSVPIPIDSEQPVEFLLGWLESQPFFNLIGAVGHRVVHGMLHTEPMQVTPELMEDLRSVIPFDPDHLPRELELMIAFSKRHPQVPQVACFDTAFHRTMPAIAKLLPIPRQYVKPGVERYGFHGLSFGYLMEELSRLDPEAATGRVILAHLGSGASLAAVSNGKSVDTTMGFTPAAGLVMGTRTGDLDPGMAFYMFKTYGMNPEKFQSMVNHESGLFGVSGISSDLRDLCSLEATDAHAHAAVELFCYQVKKWIGSFCAVLGGLDTIVFSAGIGENSPAIRSRICEGLIFLGIELDPARNNRNDGLISLEQGRVKVRVIATNEELMIARSVSRILAR